ncbi:hydroxyisourate hydrolase [Curtobacterium sp. MCBD17_032]|uniref:hydroxyisourate hydrolase n=1 Tax=Curtobacterium sp. MCBD17_032 TaxID=2175659 RepID=UPI000DA8D45D|nr:hydroxyisourate hydrolase [Curtobacterium sp. MCBD17_032]PZE85273.1 hydroxyisourate hydrolase [Curtobacterium sp. MCBD17_032]
MSHLTTHVLDTTHGRPAAGIAVTLVDADGALLASGTTDPDGRIGALGPDRLPPGEWTLTFATGAYWAGLDLPAFHPRVVVVLTVPDDPVHLHVPLLLSPFAHSTYRGS